MPKKLYRLCSSCQFKVYYNPVPVIMVAFLAGLSVLLSQGAPEIHCPDGNTVVVESEFYAEGAKWVACEDLSRPGTRGE